MKLKSKLVKTILIACVFTLCSVLVLSPIAATSAPGINAGNGATDVSDGAVGESGSETSSGASGNTSGSINGNMREGSGAAGNAAGNSGGTAGNTAEGTADAGGSSDADAMDSESGMNWAAFIIAILIAVALIAVIIALVPRRNDKGAE